MADFLPVYNHSEAALLSNASSANISTAGERAFLADQSWSWWLLQIGTPIILLVGIPGNIVSILVLQSKRFRGKSYAHYLSALGVFDSLVLLGKYVRRVDSLVEATGSDGLFTQYGDAACKLHNFAEHVCFLMSSWLVLCMTIERFIAVMFPFKKERYCKPRSAVITIIVVFAIMSYSQIFRLIIIEKDHNMCVAPEKYLHIYVAMHIYMYQLILQFMLPAVFILACNITILYKIRKLRLQVNQNGTAHNYSQYTRRNKTTCMLLTVSFTYIFTLLPLVLMSMVVHILVKVSPMAARYFIWHLNDLRYVLELVSEINYGINFYIYVMSGAQFRYQLRHICTQRHPFMSSNQTERVVHFKKSAT